MKIDLTQFRQTYLQESADHLASMEAELLALRSAPSDYELLNSIFRAAHSIKGGAGSFGMTTLVQFTHLLESLLDQLRSRAISATEDVIEVLLRSVDVVRSLLEGGADAEMPAAATQLKKEIELFLQSESGTEVAVDCNSPHSTVPLDRGVNIYRVDFAPDPEIFASGTNPIVLLRNLAALGTVSSCHLHADNLPSLADLDPGLGYLSWTMELGSVCSVAEIREVFEFVEHLAEIRVQCMDTQPGPQAASCSATSASASPEGTATPVSDRAPEKDRRKAATRAPEARSDSGSIRVPIEKVDRLIDLVGELVIAHVMAAQMVEQFEPSCLPRLREAVAAMERNTRELHERVMSVRMLPVGMLFQRYPRAVYDVAQASHKRIRLEMSGEETEIDRSMLEALGDPLIHLIRNAADHGIENPEVRLAAGKPEEGLISLKAFHRAGRIVIEIFDDGAGIDTERVRRKAIERGLVDAESQLSEDQLRLLIFEAGFSTREAITDLSGRGVGMDVVRQSVRQLNGTVSLASETGKGTTVSIELPLTLAILEGLLVRVADRTLVLPLLSVVETVPLRDEQIVRVAELGEVATIREQSIPLLRLSRFLGISAEADGSNRDSGRNRRLAVVVQAGKRKVGLIVDELLGQQQVVVKSLERHLHRVNGLMGATILGDGCVAPIVDVSGLADLNLFALQGAKHESPRTSKAPTDPSSIRSSKRETEDSVYEVV